MKLNLTGLAAPLLGRFMKQKPLRGGSLIVTIFGDALLPRGGRVSLGSLIKLAAPFGLNERLVRTAATRLVHEGWLSTRRAGKLSEYLLSQVGHGRFDEATARIYSAPDTDWSGRWTLAVLPQARAPRRQRWRKELSWLGFGEFANGAFAHPELPIATLRQLRAASPADRLLLFEATLDADDAPERLASMGWNLADLHERYRRFVQRFAPLLPALQPIADGQEQAAFVVRTLLIHEYRKLHLRDPLLPARLLPDDWAGKAAAELCRTIYAGVFQKSEEFLSTTASTLDGELPPPKAEVYARFGGLELAD